MWLPGGCTKVPWGFAPLPSGKNLVATSSSAERHARAEIGEFAIGLLGKLGVDEETLKKLVGEANPVEALKQLRSGG